MKKSMNLRKLTVFHLIDRICEKFSSFHGYNLFNFLNFVKFVSFLLKSKLTKYLSVYINDSIEDKLYFLIIFQGL